MKYNIYLLYIIKLMCKIININNTFITNEQKNIIDKIKLKVKKNNDNPKVKIEHIILKNNKENEKKFNIIQDGYLIAGTKQRVAKLFIKKILKSNKNIDTLVYAGTSNGYGAIATAYAAYKLGLKSSVFLSGNYDLDKNTRQINTLLALNSKITFCNTFKEARDMEYKESNILVDKSNKTYYKNNDSQKNGEKWKTKLNYFIIPMGLNDENGQMVELLSNQIKKALKNTLLEKIKDEKLRFWLVAGSGGIIKSLFNVFPNSIFFIYLTGSGKYREKVKEWANKNKNRVNILKPNKVLNNSNKNKMDRQKYYSSVKNYDDMIWPYIKKYGQNGDFIWNVCSDDYLYF